MGAFGTFSFHGTKTVTTGEGGMFVTNDIGLYEKVLTLSNHGRARSQTRSSGPEWWASSTRCRTSRRQSAAHKWSGSMSWFHESGRYILRSTPRPAGCVAGISWNPEPPVHRKRILDANGRVREVERDNVWAHYARNSPRTISMPGSFFHPLSATPPFAGSSGANGPAISPTVLSMFPVSTTSPRSSSSESRKLSRSFVVGEKSYVLWGRRARQSTIGHHRAMGGAGAGNV